MARGGRILNSDRSHEDQRRQGRVLGELDAALCRAGMGPAG